MCTRVWLSLLILLIFVQADAAVQADEIHGDEAKVKLALRGQSLANYRLGTSENGYRHSQFEITLRMSDETNEGCTVLRMVCEAAGDKAAILILNKQGVPYGVFESGNAYFISTATDASIIKIKDVNFHFICNSVNSCPVLS